ncbi:hypothetical protein [Mycoplasma mycoides]|uniref:hypothetical protein n=1 Tax=Mycoplasma mycoides TaxID=2102 RepID=UPI00223F879D|nr:hypothetical protein [Mycoplasma mycoides]QVK06352.1 hypothetical protein I7641_01840 [Mycoplasma mycoides subsp. capri]QVK08878.1 hypothetical protein I7644_01880 [Mycoplasma mycoides subsp. capri]
MKKSLFVLSFLTILSSSILVVSCKNNNINNNSEHIKDNSESKNKHNNQNNTNSKNDITIKNPINKEDQPKHIDDSLNKNPETKKEENNQITNSTNQQNDQPTEKEPNPDNLSREKENILSLLKDLNNNQQIKSYVEELITRKEHLISDQNKNKLWTEYNEKISNWFNKKQYEEIKKELLKLLKEVEEISKDKKSIEDKIKAYKDINVTEDRKDGILIEFKFFFETKFSINQEEKTNSEISKFLKEIEQLIFQKNHGELKNKLFELVDQIEQLEKNNKS